MSEEFTVEDEMNKKYISNENILLLSMSLKRRATARGITISNDDAVDEIRSAIEAVNERRRFEPTEKELYESKYETLY